MPAVDYLSNTLATLSAQGADECDLRVVIADGYRPSLPDGWDLDATKERFGTRSVMWRAFRWATKAGIDRLLFFQDDVIPCINLVRAVASAPIPSELAFLDLFDVKEVHNAALAGIYRTPAMGRDGGGYMCAQAMVFPAEVVHWLAKQDPMSVHLPWTGKRRGADSVLGRLLAESPWPLYGAVLPAMVEHVGAISASWPGNTTLEGRPQPLHPAPKGFDAAVMDWSKLYGP
jgi:hypothetical protein